LLIGAPRRLGIQNLSVRELTIIEVVVHTSVSITRSTTHRLALGIVLVALALRGDLKPARLA